MLLLKLALIPASVLLSSLAGRYFGHAIAGVLAGLPMVAGPMMALLLLDHDAQTVAPITLATVSVIPAALSYFVTYAWMARRARWWTCLLVSATVYLALGWVMSALALPRPWPELLALASPWLALAAMPAVAPMRGAVPVPHSEILVRMLCAALIGAAILYGAANFPPRINGLLLSWPVTGTILPSFTLQLHGRTAAINLLRGFANGLIGFAIFFCGLNLLLENGVGKWESFALSVGAAVLTAWLVYRVRSRRRTAPP